MSVQPENQQETKLWNEAVSLSLEWGEWWLKPINSRLRALHPELSDDDAEDLNKMAKYVQNACFALFQREFDGQMKLVEAQSQMKSAFPWLEEPNLNRLQSQGMYYARK
jgi:hypothetical protein